VELSQVHIKSLLEKLIRKNLKIKRNQLIRKNQKIKRNQLIRKNQKMIRKNQWILKNKRNLIYMEMKLKI